MYYNSHFVYFRHILILCIFGFLIALLGCKRLYLHESTKPIAVINFEVGEHNSSESFHKLTDHTIANEIRKKIKVLCWIMTFPLEHSATKHTRDTWGRRCNKLLIFSSEAGEYYHKIIYRRTSAFTHFSIPQSAISHIFILYGQVFRTFLLKEESWWIIPKTILPKNEERFYKFWPKTQMK